MVQGFRQAHHGYQDHADADRDIHVGVTLPQGGGRRREERHSGIGNRRQGDERGYPVQQCACRRAHRIKPARRRTGPYADGDQHDVAGGEPRDRKRADQLAPDLIRGGGKSLRIKRHQPVAKRLDPRHEIGCQPHLAAPDDFQAPGCHVDAT